MTSKHKVRITSVPDHLISKVSSVPTASGNTKNADEQIIVCEYSQYQHHEYNIESKHLEQIDKNNFYVKKDTLKSVSWTDAMKKPKSGVGTTKIEPSALKVSAPYILNDVPKNQWPTLWRFKYSKSRRMVGVRFEEKFLVIWLEYANNQVYGDHD